MKPFNGTISGLGTTIFTTMSALSVEHDAINLGQGFPDEDGPEDILETAARHIQSGPNQYPPMMGVPSLRQAVAEHNRRFHDLDVDWRDQVLVTSGATEALTASLLALLNPGDEVVLLEPAYDCYLPIVALAGAIPKFVRLEPPDWVLPIDALRDALSRQTKVIILNSPMNPNGKVFQRSELEHIAALLEEFDAYAICDEVYEHLVFSDAVHIPLMTLPGMANRCLRIGSAGKTFSLTGWKVGYVTGSPALIRAVAKAHQFITFTTPPNLQEAVAFGLGKPDSYFSDLATELQSKRDHLSAGLADVGFDVGETMGTYFLTADIRSFGIADTDAEFSEKLVREARVGTVPVSAFYAANGPKHWVRFCFCKKTEVLDDAINRLKAFFGS